jgi:cytidylate kinase
MAVITFGGHIGSGKSTVAPLVARALGYENVYVGGMFRLMAKERGMTLETFYASLANDPALEKSIDAKQIDLMRQGNIVVQGRIAYFFARQSGQPAINIFLAVDPAVGAERKIEEGAYPGKTVQEAMAIQEDRYIDERAHYRALYNIGDHLDSSGFDIVCDTTNLTPDEVVAILLKEIRARLSS